ncbi:hypothetical protein [Streptomyces marianii]|uniref:Uncharacterized protein n=1 Tax=Streptomyces marianii TaxID=1817406 RepID=A0A5R9E089_9ACTN|nr:hypothetical protein [Streptomyces marianii]TLQ42469.1 hypothetical protein FEF34_03965 [Streptomyces marianii]
MGAAEEELAPAWLVVPAGIEIEPPAPRETATDAADDRPVLGLGWCIPPALGRAGQQVRFRHNTEAA